MTATAITVPTTRPTEAPSTELGTTVRPVWKTGLAAGVSAAVATTATAGIAHTAGVSLAVGGKAIPLLGFAQTDVRRGDDRHAARRGVRPPRRPVRSAPSSSRRSR